MMPEEALTNPDNLTYTPLRTMPSPTELLTVKFNRRTVDSNTTSRRVSHGIHQARRTACGNQYPFVFGHRHYRFAD